ncbi:MAG: AgmX/PglI C-terminal domain-containing protein [Bdellovibrionaceae bacterium]|nr:AgmX/PglI C-terminal domain-containing protein [Pseudobdellovibrionaceae bacterium]
MRKLILAIATIAFGAWLILTQIWPWSDSGTMHAITVGQVRASEGEVTASLAGTPGSENVTAPRALRAREVLTTGPAAQVTLEFSGGSELRLLENSRLVAEPISGATQVTILSGRAEVIRPGSPDALLVYQDGRRLNVTAEGTATPSPSTSAPTIISDSAATAGPSPTPEPNAAEAPVESEIVVPTQAEDATPTPAPTPPRKLPSKAATDGKTMNNKTLSNEDIQRVLSAQSSRFQRCFVDHMKRKGSTSAKGSLAVAFIIRTNGKVDSQRIVNSPFDDTLFHNCVLEVIDRTPFPDFEGDPIRVNDYPLHFE